MTDLKPDFDFNEYLNNRIHDEFSPMMEKFSNPKPKQVKSADLGFAIDNYFLRDRLKKVSGS